MDQCNAVAHSSKQINQQYKMEDVHHSNDNEEEQDVGPEYPMNNKSPGSSDIGPLYDPGLKFKQTKAPVLELRGREVIFAIAVFFLFSMCVGLVIVLATKPIVPGSEPTKRSSHVKKANDRMCLTKACMAKAVNIMEALNTTSDPCDNFYEYACTGWLSKTSLPADEEVYSIDNEIKERVDMELHALLTTPYTRSERSGGPISANWKAAHLYEKCMDVGQIDRQNAQPLLDAIKRIGGWALIGKNTGGKLIKCYWEEVWGAICTIRIFSVLIFYLETGCNLVMVRHLLYNLFHMLV